MAQWKSAFFAISSWPYPIEILINLLLDDVMLYSAATLSTSGVGSTPGNSTKKIGVLSSISLNVSNILNGGYSTYFSPISSFTNSVTAEVKRSGRIHLKINNL